MKIKDFYKREGIKYYFYSGLIIFLWFLISGQSIKAIEKKVIELESPVMELPTKENPLIIDMSRKRVLIYTEVSGMHLYQPTVHWGIVFKDGKFGDRAILKAYSNHLAFYDALIKIGAKPGNNLNKNSAGEYVKGSLLNVSATWPGLNKELPLKDIFSDSSNKGFAIRFGGNRKASEEQNTGCITCLESCWISITSNSNYPMTDKIRRFISPNSYFKGIADVLPEDGKPIILIYSLAE